nr:MAG TPA: hypothetical protein [Crassvirales sp.]
MPCPIVSREIGSRVFLLFPCKASVSIVYSDCEINR